MNNISSLGAILTQKQNTKTDSEKQIIGIHSLLYHVTADYYILITHYLTKNYHKIKYEIFLINRTSLNIWNNPSPSELAIIKLSNNPLKHHSLIQSKDWIRIPIHKIKNRQLLAGRMGQWRSKLISDWPHACSTFDRPWPIIVLMALPIILISEALTAVLSLADCR